MKSVDLVAVFVVVIVVVVVFEMVRRFGEPIKDF